MVAAHRIGHFGQVPLAGGRHDDTHTARDAASHRGQRTFVHNKPLVGQQATEVLVEGRDAIVVEACSDRAEHGQFGRVGVEQFAVAGELATHRAQRIVGTAALELVDGDDLREVEHVDLFELRIGTELGSHHVHRHIDIRHDGGIALADTRRLHHHQIGTPRLGGEDDVGERCGHLTATRAGSERAEEHLRAVDGVHANAVAQQCTAATPPRGVDGDDGDAQLVALVEPEAAQ